MSIYCQKCGTENEDGAKFCKSCGTPLSAEPIQPNNANSASAGNTFQLVKKIVIWGVAIFITFVLVVNLINFIQERNKENRMQNLRSECTNNNAQACYELGTALDSYDDEGREALAKGCQLGHINACQQGEHYEEGCNLKDGKSCYEYAKSQYGVLNLDYTPVSRKYYQLACQYGYSQGCMEQ